VKTNAAIQAQRTLQATERLLAAKVAHDDLIAFAQLMTPDPDEPDNVSASLYKTAPHHRMLAEALQDVESGKCLRLLISMPPQHGKSQLSSRFFPAWLIGRTPWKNLMLGSYNQDFANEFGDDVRNIMDTPAYKLVFPKSGLRIGSRAKDHMVTTRGGKLSFLGRGGAGTGRPADCMPGDTGIITSVGKVRLDDLIKIHDKTPIASFDHATNSVVFRRVVAWQSRDADELFEITTTSGQSIRATGNHRIFVAGRGYTKACEIAHGDTLVRVLPDSILDIPGRGEETGQTRNKSVLLASVRVEGSEIEPTDIGVRELPTSIPEEGIGSDQTGKDGQHESVLLEEVRTGVGTENDGVGDVRALQNRFSGAWVRSGEEGSTRAKKHVLLTGLHGTGIQEEMPVRFGDPEENEEVVFCGMPEQVPQATDIVCRNNVSSVQDDLQAEVITNAILRSTMRESCTLGTNDREGKLALQGRPELCATVSRNVGDSAGQGQQKVRSLLDGRIAHYGQVRGVDSTENELDTASHRPQSDEQRTGELDYSLFDVSCCSSQVKIDTVSVVRRVRSAGVKVYDLQVEGTGNFFADEVLVHNCFIIDDPIKDAKEAESPTIRNDVWQWFTKVAFTRCHATSAIVVIQTRWSEDDLIGRLTDHSNPCYDAEEASRWTYINIPAIFTDPRDEPIAKALGIASGQPLWPERFTVEHLLSAKRLNPTGFSALYMGRPTPPEGDFFKTDMLITYSSMAELPRNMVMYGTGDLAVTPDKDSDMTCVGNWGVDSNGDLWLLPDLYWERKAADQVVDQLIDFAKAHKWMTFAVEKGPIDRAVGPFLQSRMRERGTYFHVEKFPTIGNKRGRALSIRGLMAQGRVHFPTFARWWPAAKEQMLKFTGSGSDREDDFCDMVAMVGQLMDVLMVGSKPVDKTEEKVVCIGTLRWIKQMDEYKRRQNRRHKALAGM
jgi:predicted phage terminase large subunit-like protein